MDDTNTPFEVPRQYIVLAAILGLYAFLATLNAIHQIRHVATSDSPSAGADSDIESNIKNSDSGRTFITFSHILSNSPRHLYTLFNKEQSKKRMVAFLKSKQFLILFISILLSFLSYGFIYTRINHVMAASAMAIQIEAQALQLKEEEEVDNFDPYEILQIKPNASRRKINKAFVTLATKAAASPSSSIESVDNPSAIHVLSRLHIAFRALTDEEGKVNFLIYGHPNGPAPTNSIVPLPKSIHILHPFISCLDPGSIIFVLAFISVLAVFFKISPALRSQPDVVEKEKEKPKPPFIYFGGLVPKDIHAVCIDPSVVTIESNAFRGCTSIQTVEIPFSVKEVQKSAFRDCTSLQTVTFLPAPKMIMYKSTDLSPSPPYLSDAVLVETLPLRSSTAPSSHTHADTNTTTVLLPHSSTAPSSHTDMNTNIVLPLSETIMINNHTTIVGSSIFRDCQSLQTITLPSTLTKIPKSTFKGCTALSSIKPSFLPELEKVGHEAFDGCAALCSVRLLPCVKKIGICAFHSCKNLEIAEVVSTRTEIGRHAFGGCPKLAFLPDGYSNEEGRCGRSEICGRTVVEDIDIIGGGIKFAELDESNAGRPHGGIKESHRCNGVLLL